ncbi:hypothetical protein BDN72DRAFT_857257 [Pluteus cervinus]|uniref:Uncharacterized protein n=1 Tax=Pluteus cervinus TaxID=181527 RepID=A0ACD3AWB5_9AGAR|nr:hypothetical protein BDN72DRAFT_857257 [Pluteus cervinus]
MHERGLLQPYPVRWPRIQFEYDIWTIRLEVSYLDADRCLELDLESEEKLNMEGPTPYPPVEKVTSYERSVEMRPIDEPGFRVVQIGDLGRVWGCFRTRRTRSSECSDRVQQILKVTILQVRMNDEKRGCSGVLVSSVDNLAIWQTGFPESWGAKDVQDQR